MTDVDPVAAAVEAAWQRNQVRIRSRLEHVLGGVEVLADGGAPAPDVEQEAHVLAGALGTYGRPGSALLRRAELALAQRDRLEAAALLEELRALTIGLRG